MGIFFPLDLIYLAQAKNFKYIKFLKFIYFHGKFWITYFNKLLKLLTPIEKYFDDIEIPDDNDFLTCKHLFIFLLWVTLATIFMIFFSICFIIPVYLESFLNSILYYFLHTPLLCYAWQPMNIFFIYIIFVYTTCMDQKHISLDSNCLEFELILPYVKYLNTTKSKVNNLLGTNFLWWSMNF